MRYVVTTKEGGKEEAHRFDSMDGAEEFMTDMEFLGLAYEFDVFKD